ncbi:MAG TPA: aldo/keto reductase, partial [Actinomycetales bacterium]|nr:aldo/keto reductase [Actinomycetales bacterium]
MATPIAPRTLGSSDLVISGVGMGCNNFSRPASPTVEQNASTRVIHAAIDAGITFFDTAEMYGSEPGMSETFMGVALRHRRDQVQIATKWGLKGKAPAGMEDKGPRGGETYIRAAIEGSLRRLQTDYVDLYQLHEPDPEVPIEETLGVLADLVAEGKVRQIGHSNFSADQLREADDAASTREDGLRFVSGQNEYSLLNREVEGELLGECVERNIGFLPYFPLYNGLLTGKYSASSGEGRIT